MLVKIDSMSKLAMIKIVLKCLSSSKIENGYMLVVLIMVQKSLPIYIADNIGRKGAGTPSTILC